MNIIRLVEPTPIPDGYAPLQLDASTRNADLRPADYTVVDTEIDEDFTGGRQRYYGDFRRMGEALTRLKGLELEPEPGSEKPVPAGNYSIRRPGGGFFITGSGTNKNQPSEEGILLIHEVDYGKGVIRKKGRAKPSRETLIHDLIYACYPHVHAITHTHMQDQLMYDMAVHATDVPIFFATLREALHVVDLLQIEPYVRLRGHGQFAIGGSVDEVLRINEKHHSQAVRNVRTAAIINGVYYAAAAVIAGVLLSEGVRRGYDAIRDFWNK